MKWPAMIAAKPFVMPSGASIVPVKISAIDTAAPNHKSETFSAEFVFDDVLANKKSPH